MKNIILSLVIAILLTSCGIFDNDDNKLQEGVLQPFAVGNWWEYEIQRFSEPDTVREVVSELVEVTVGDETFISFAWNSEIDWGDFPEYIWLARNGDQGLYLMGGVAETDTLFINALQYKYPAEVGETWEVPQVSFSRTDYQFYISDTLSVTLIDNNRQIETPSGKYSCFVYYFQVSMGYDVLGYFGYYLYYKPGIGLVAQEEWGEHPSGNPDQNQLLSRLVLIDYHLVR